MCRHCLQYGHSKINWQDNQRCAKYGEENHNKEGCQRDAANCYHCKEKHISDNFKYAEYKYQAEIKAVQSKEKVLRHQTIAILQRLMPDYRNMNYAGSAKRSQKKASGPVVNDHNERRKVASLTITTAGETTIDDTAS